MAGRGYRLAVMYKGMTAAVPAEMYGYVFGAAKAGVRHNPADYFHWMYPGYFTSGEPHLLPMHSKTTATSHPATCRHMSQL